MNRPLFVTTSRRPGLGELQAAARWSEALALPRVERAEGNLRELIVREAAGGALVATGRGLTLVSSEGEELRFHGSIGVLRARTVASGGRDALIEACALRPGDRVVDATAGRCSDALVLAAAVGPAGEVTALEADRIVSAVMRDGLERLGSPIRFLHAEHGGWLRAQPDASVDVLYFDPMFPKPAAATRDFEFFRQFAEPAPLTAETVREARRVARRRLVMADGERGAELRRLGFRDVTRNRWAARRFGVIDLDPRSLP